MLLIHVRNCPRTDGEHRTFIAGKVSSVKTSNREVMPGATPSKAGLTRVEYFLYTDGTNAISAIARLK
jgi:hypothetical protein